MKESAANPAVLLGSQPSAVMDNGHTNAYPVYNEINRAEWEVEREGAASNNLVFEAVALKEKLECDDQGQGRFRQRAQRLQRPRGRSESDMIEHQGGGRGGWGRTCRGDGRRQVRRAVEGAGSHSAFKLRSCWAA